MFRALRNSFLVLNLVTTATMVLAAFAAVYVVTWTYVQRDTDRTLVRIGEEGRRPDLSAPRGAPEPAPGDGAPPAASPRREPVPGEDRSVSFSVTVDAAGAVLATSSFMDLGDDFTAAAAGAALDRGRDRGTVRLEGGRWAFLARPAPGGTRIAFLDVSAQQAVLSRLVWTFAGAAAVMLVLIALASVIFAERAIAPIREAFERQKRFVADASHELKTPLAVIATNADVLLADPGERIGTHAKWLGYIKEETARLAKLTDDLLSLARLDGTDGRRDVAPVDLGEVVRGAVLAMEAVFFERGVAVRHAIGEGVRVAADGGAMAQLSRILLDNALKYAGERGAVDVRLERRGRTAVLAVTNTGAGIGAEHLPRIFDRFYRADPSRTRGTGGHGLGLAIAKAIVERHGGRIAAHSTPGETTTFTVELPAAAG